MARSINIAALGMAMMMASDAPTLARRAVRSAVSVEPQQSAESKALALTKAAVKRERKNAKRLRGRPA